MVLTVFLAFALTASASAASLSVKDVSVGEGDGTAKFKVTLSKKTDRTVKVAYVTADGTATAGHDYTKTSGSLRIPAKKTTKSVSVPIINDDVHESTETFKLKLSNPKHASIKDGSATGTIVDDDPAASNVTISWQVPNNWGTISSTGTGTCNTVPASTGNCTVQSGNGSVTLVATSSNVGTYQFDHWAGSTCTGTAADNQMTFTNPTADRACEAIFCLDANPSICAPESKTATLAVLPRRSW